MADNENMKSKLIITIIDKLFLAAIILTLAWYIESNIEEFKSNNSLSNELNIIRAEKFGEIWSLRLQESMMHRYIRYTNAINHSRDTESDFGKNQLKTCFMIRDSLMLNNSKLSEVMQENRFWIGEDEYYQTLVFIESIDNFFDVNTSDATTEEKDEAKELMKKTRKNILNIRTQMFNKK